MSALCSKWQRGEKFKQTRVNGRSPLTLEVPTPAFVSLLVPRLLLLLVVVLLMSGFLVRFR